MKGSKVSRVGSSLQGAFSYWELGVGTGTYEQCQTVCVHHQLVPSLTFSVNSSTIHQDAQAKNLGVLISSPLSPISYSSKLLLESIFIATTLVQAIITSFMDYGKSLSTHLQ